MVSGISDDDEAEYGVSSDVLAKRFGMPINIELTDTAPPLDPADKNLATCPIAYGKVRSAHSVFFATGHSLFVYNVREQYGTGIAADAELADCAIVRQHLCRPRAAEGSGRRDVAYTARRA